MPNARALDKRRKSIKNIRKITRTMELIATARFKKAMDRATAAAAYTKRITKLVSDLASTGLEVSHPLMEPRAETKRSRLLILTSNRGFCGGFNGNVIRLTQKRIAELKKELGAENFHLEVSGKRGISAFESANEPIDVQYIHFEDKTRYEEVEVLANKYLEEFEAGEIDRFDVAYMQFKSTARQVPVIETLLPLTSLGGEETIDEPKSSSESMYEFDPSAESILEEVVPSSFKVKLFNCFLDAAVSEQVARMVAMKGATENAGDLIKTLSRQYNRARQSQITGEIMEIIGGVEALNS
jgi:F-type H+-transporting ATPase subunit gamma